MTETIINRALGADLIVSRSGDRIRVIRERTEPVTLHRSRSGFTFFPGLLLSPEDSAPIIQRLELDRARALLEEIRTALDGVEWSADTSATIASALIAAGYQVRDYNESETPS
jgi:hypothetical protein